MADRALTPGPRLGTVLAFLSESPQNACIADIGCDHGKLVAAALELHPGWRGIAADISAPSLEKARQLARERRLSDRLSCRLGDGLTVLENGEADTVVICGMGGELIAGMLASCETPLKGASLAVLQPMRGQEELNARLFQNGWHTEKCRVTEDAGKLYEILAVRPPDGTPVTLPEDWPAGYFGICPFAERDAAFYELARRKLAHTRRLLAAARGTRGEAPLEADRAALARILEGESK